MPALSSKQITELGNYFSAFAEAVGDFRMSHYASLTDSQRADLKSHQKKLLDKADELYTNSAILVMDEIDASLTSIKTINTKIERDYRQLQNIQKAIDVAAGCVKLGISIFSLNPKEIGQSITELLRFFKEPKSIKTPPAATNKKI